MQHEIKKYVKIAIPPKGRTARRMVAELADHGYIDKESAENLCWVFEADRRRIDVETNEITAGTRANYSKIEEIRTSMLLCTNEKLEDVAERVPKSMSSYGGLPGLERLYKDDKLFHSLGVATNLNREGNPDRYVLGSLKTYIGGVPVVFVGTEHSDAPDRVGFGSVHLAVVGYDEIAARYAGEPGDFKRSSRIKRWPGFSNHSVEGEPIILGSAGLQDYCAHVIIADNTSAFEDIRFSKDSFTFYGIDKVFVDKKYGPVYAHFTKGSNGMGTSAPPAKFIHKEKVEHVVAENGELGIVIANTGASIGKLGLYVFGLPVLQSETLLIADGDIIENCDDVSRVASLLLHEQYTDKERINSYALWFSEFCKSIGRGNWKEMPDIDDMLFDTFDFRSSWIDNDSINVDESLNLLRQKHSAVEVKHE